MKSLLLIFVVGALTGPSVGLPGPSSVKVHISPKNELSILNGQGEISAIPMNKPTQSVFSANFKYLVASEGPEGRTMFEDQTPDQKTLQALESKHYVHPETNSAFSLSRNGGQVKVHGLIGGKAIKHNGFSHEVYEVKSVFEGEDYVDLGLNFTPPTIVSRAAVNANPEVWVVFDYDNSQTFGQSRNAILDYLGVFFHAINNRYATIQDANIAFKISGVTTMSSRSAQPFMENNRVSSGVDINKALEDFSYWSLQNQNSIKFDLAAVISGVDFVSQDSSGSYSSGVAGLAYLSAACLKTSTRWYATSVTEDRGGYYDGVFSVAHEFAHNLGSHHDGSGSSEGCPWSDGYIMSYEGWGTTNKFYFSECSINAMKNYISSSSGSCTRSTQSSTTIPISQDNVGDRYNMQQLCVKYTDNAAAVPEPTKTADELCRNLACRYPIENKPGWYSIITLNHPPGDDTPCGDNGGKCVNGVCSA